MWHTVFRNKKIVKQHICFKQQQLFTSSSFTSFMGKYVLKLNGKFENVKTQGMRSDNFY